MAASPRPAWDEHPRTPAHELWESGAYPSHPPTWRRVTVRALGTVWHGAWHVSVHHHPNILTPAWRRGSRHPSFSLKLQLATLSGGETEGQCGELPQSMGGTGFPRNYPINATNGGRGLHLPGLKARPTQAQRGREIVQWPHVCVMSVCDV